MWREEQYYFCLVEKKNIYIDLNLKCEFNKNNIIYNGKTASLGIFVYFHWKLFYTGLLLGITPTSLGIRTPVKYIEMSKFKRWKNIIFWMKGLLTHFSEETHPPKGY